MFDHVILTVSDLAVSRRCYEAALAPLGYRPAEQIGDDLLSFVEELPHVGAVPTFWLRVGSPSSDGPHIAFAATDRAQVEAFHAQALAAGAVDEGGPGLRAQYHPSYYAAYVRDPDGRCIEAVCHRPQ